MTKATAKIVSKFSATAKQRVSVLSSGGGGDVTITDQNDNVIDTIAAPGTYQVIVVSSIADNGGPYTNSIIDNG